MKLTRRSFLYFLTVLLTIAVAVGPSGDVLARGDFTGYYDDFVHTARPEKAPEIPFFGGDGKIYTLADFRGKVVLLNFWATWCPACIVEMPQLDRLQARLGGKDFMVLTLSQDGGGIPVVKRFLKKRNLPNLPVFIDRNRRLGTAFKQDLLPTTILLDAEGRELGRIIGPVEWDSPKAMAFIKRYLPGGPSS